MLKYLNFSFIERLFGLILKKKVGKYDNNIDWWLIFHLINSFWSFFTFF